MIAEPLKTISILPTHQQQKSGSKFMEDHKTIPKKSPCNKKCSGAFSFLPASNEKKWLVFRLNETENAFAMTIVHNVNVFTESNR